MGPPFPLSIPLFRWYPQSKDIFNKSQYEMLTTHYEFADTQHLNAQGSRVITVVVQLGAVKIYVAAVEALAQEKRERQDDT